MESVKEHGTIIPVIICIVGAGCPTGRYGILSFMINFSSTRGKHNMNSMEKMRWKYGND